MDWRRGRETEGDSDGIGIRKPKKNARRGGRARLLEQQGVSLTDGEVRFPASIKMNVKIHPDYEFVK